MKRICVVIALVAACATAPRVGEPLVLDFRWEPEGLDVASTYALPNAYDQQKEMHSLTLRNAFDSRFERVTLGTDPDAPSRVVLTIVETARPAYAQPTRVRGNNTVQSNASQRCGTVRYVLFAGGTAIARDEFPLDCDAAGRPDYRRAGLRASGAVAGALRPPTARSR